jgi:hypothetical protein
VNLTNVYESVLLYKKGLDVDKTAADILCLRQLASAYSSLRSGEECDNHRLRKHTHCRSDPTTISTTTGEVVLNMPQELKCRASASVSRFVTIIFLAQLQRLPRSCVVDVSTAITSLLIRFRWASRLQALEMF